MTYPSNYPNEEPRSPYEPQQRQVPIQRRLERPMVTYVILGITVFVFILQELTRVGPLREPFVAIARLVLGNELMDLLLLRGLADDLLVLIGAKIPELIVEGQFWRLFTPVLLHASLVHIGFNMYALFAIGPSLEGYYGHWRFLALYLLGAFGGNVLSFLLSPGLAVGASTAVFGLVAAYGVFIFQNRAMFGPQARAMLTNVVVIVVINIFLGLSPQIDNWGHMGGLITGLAFSWFAGPVMTVTGIYPAYELVDERSPATAWLVGITLAVIFVGLTMVGINSFS
jgi:rhomboid protease GluP